MASMEQLADTFKLLADKNRLTILSLLQEKELCVCEIVEALQTSQPNISQHMRKLKDGGLVKETKRGQWVYYALNVTEPYLVELFKSLPSQKDRLAKLTCDTIDCCN